LKTNRIIISIIIITLTASSFLDKNHQDIRYSYSLSYKFENRGTNQILIDQEDLIIPTFINNTYQTVSIVEKTHPYTIIIADEDKNQAILIKIERELEVEEKVSFEVEYKIKSSNKPIPDFNHKDAVGEDQIPINLVFEYTSPTETFLSDNQEIKKLSASLTEGKETVLEKTLTVLEYIINETEYHNFEHPLYPNQTIIEERGDCDDQSILLITMLRSLKIPSYLQIGLLIHPNIKESKTMWEGHVTSIKEGVGWHGWAMVYIPPWGWVPVDPTMTQSNNALDVLRNAPQYDTNIIQAFNVSDQPYIGDTLSTKQRIINSSLYISIIDNATQVYNNDYRNRVWITIGLGIALITAIIMMFHFRD
jgi:transglutaminase-like putative cysteine protease